MPRQTSSKSNRSDLQRFFESVQPHYVSPKPDGPYTPDDRFRDFRRVFCSDDTGRRVLAQIIDACEGPPIGRADVSDHALLAFRAGQREIGLRIVMWLQAVPVDWNEMTEESDA